MNNIVLFDGDCHFCDLSVQFIINHDPKERFYFAPLKSELGKELLSKYRLPAEIDSIVLIEKEKAYVKSTAALRICRHLRGAWKCLYVFKFVPIFVRDFAYDLIAKNRYKWFGEKDRCKLPSQRIRKRFLT
jgi:predicted DCC family thiol-disulfide oxidoreductase YuxK